MKNILCLLPLFITVSMGAQEHQPQKTIDSVKAVQAQEQRATTTEPMVIDGDALPLNKEQQKKINDNNRINDQNNNVNGNSIDSNDKKVGTNTVRYPAKRGETVAPSATTINRNSLPNREIQNSQILDSLDRKKSNQENSPSQRNGTKPQSVTKPVPKNKQ